MTAIDLLELLRARPFEPFRIYASDGRTYDVHHPDQAMVLISRVILPLPSPGDVPARTEHLALSHIVRIEELSTEQTPRSAGNGDD